MNGGNLGDVKLYLITKRMFILLIYSLTVVSSKEVNVNQDRSFPSLNVILTRTSFCKNTLS